MFVYIPFCRESNADQENIYILGFFQDHSMKYFDFSEPKKKNKYRAIRISLGLKLNEILQEFKITYELTSPQKQKIPNSIRKNSRLFDIISGSVPFFLTKECKLYMDDIQKWSKNILKISNVMSCIQRHVVSLALS